MERMEFYTERDELGVPIWVEVDSSILPPCLKPTNEDIGDFGGVRLNCCAECKFTECRFKKARWSRIQHRRERYVNCQGKD